MKIFITGATGFIGSRLAVSLAEKGHTIHALYRSESKTGILDHPNIRLFKGDILDAGSLENAMKSCSQVYHTAAFANVWVKDRSVIYRLNIEGTMNVVRAAINQGIKKLVCTSTAGVLGPSGDIELDESSPVPETFFLDYESSKAILENVLKTVSLTGPETVIVNPARVYGPGLLSESNGVTRMADKYIRGKWHFIPGTGKSRGNYVFIDDVVNGHILAMEKGKNGGRYILGGENASFDEFFRVLAKISGKKYFLIRIPLFVMLAISGLIMLKTFIFGGKPLITPALVRKFNHNFRLSSGKAMKELGYDPLPLEAGLRLTVDWLRGKAGT